MTAAVEPQPGQVWRSRFLPDRHVAVLAVDGQRVRITAATVNSVDQARICGRAQRRWISVGQLRHTYQPTDHRIPEPEENR